MLGLSLTGYLLPWDQKGYWATKVATNIAAITPLVGPELQKLIIGGADYGHHTLTRFFALHAGVLPGAIIVLLVGHIYLFRRHGLTAKEPRLRPDAAFWPDQVLKDAVACLAVMAAVLFLVIRARGAELGAPADPAEAFDARPEWYFLFLFQFLKYFPGGTEVLGAIVIPSLLLLIVFAMPFLGKWRLGHRFNLGLLWALIAGVGMLTWLAMAEDRRNPDYVAGLKSAEFEAHRVKELAQSPTGISQLGAVNLLRTDPLTQGPKLFAKNCASCHRYEGQDGLGRVPTESYTVQTNDTLGAIARFYSMSEEQLLSLNRLKSGVLTNQQRLAVHALQTASDLKGFASRSWLSGLLAPAHIAASNYFGGTKFKDGKMAKFVNKDVAGFAAQEKEQLQKVLMALSSEAQLKSQREADQRDTAAIAEGRTLLANDTMRCTECHQFHKPSEDTSGPDLTGYGSREWLIGIITNPKHERFYGKRNDRMPAFAADQILDAASLGLLADWLRGEWYESVERRVDNHKN